MYKFTIKRLKNIVSDFGKVDYLENQLLLECVV